MHAETLRRWVRQAAVDEGPRTELPPEERTELPPALSAPVNPTRHPGPSGALLARYQMGQR